MKYLNFFLFILLVGCNSNQIGVTRLDPQSSAVSPQPGIAQSSVASSNVQSASTIFFEQIRFRDGLASVVNGIGFLDRDAENTDSFIVKLKQETAISESPAFTPVSGGALLVDRNANESTLRFMNVETLESTDLLTVPAVASTASTPSRDSIGWVDLKGNAYISRAGHSHKLNIGGPNLQAKRIGELNGKSEFYVLAQGDSSRVLIFNATSSDPEMTFSADQFAMSPKGEQFLLINGNSASVYNRSTNKTMALIISTQIHEATWINEDNIAFWTDISGQPELDTLNTKTDQESEITMIDSSMTNPGMICPVLNNGDIYFADFRDGKSLILRARESSGAWNVTAFAEAKDSRFGLICPSVSNSF